MLNRLQVPLAILAKMASFLSLMGAPFQHFFSILYIVMQKILKIVFAPTPPPPAAADQKRGHPRVAVIGTGLTGVSSAAHCVGHGLDVKLFEARSQEEGLGGIWSV